MLSFVLDFCFESLFLLFLVPLHCVLSQVLGLPSGFTSNSFSGTFPNSCFYRHRVLLYLNFQAVIVLVFKEQGRRDALHLSSCSHRRLQFAVQWSACAVFGISLCLFRYIPSFYLLHLDGKSCFITQTRAIRAQSLSQTN